MARKISQILRSLIQQERDSESGYVAFCQRLYNLKLLMKSNSEATELLDDLFAESDSPLNLMAEQDNAVRVLSLLTELQLQKAETVYVGRREKAAVWEALYEEALGRLKPSEGDIQAAHEAAKETVMKKVPLREPHFKHGSGLALLHSFSITPTGVFQHLSRHRSNRT
ncbi:hypothetical protein BKA70DRAFT_1394108 [Coprinopsis sp. MPI-PUGE-AT-0042]|nr:hypothetical protein BKA70DRAFT_1394108 [Coprinopsis sp. MPI-PUGE-AT-0042]